MRKALIAALSVLGLMVSNAAGAAPLKLTPASPQPKPRSGLAVKYYWLGEPPLKFQSLDEAKSTLGSAKPGRPLRGLDYRDTNVGDPVMTFNQHYNVAASIRGYIKFDAPGVYNIEMWTNDGIDARISGQRVGYEGGRTQGCESTMVTEVEVPQAGWYKLDIEYFQKYGTSCLMMKWAKDGQKLNWVPNSAFGY